MKIFVTGASGFLGKHLCDSLKDHEVISVNSKTCDLRDPTALKRFSTVKFDQIYHLAAWTQAGDFCLNHPGEQWLINQKMNTHILNWWLEDQPQAKMIAMGTSCSYAEDSKLTEDEYFSGIPIESLFTYAMTKRMLLTGLISIHKQYKLDYLYLIPSTLYGANYHTDGRQMHFIFDLVRKIIRGVLFNEPVILWGNGHQKRELIHVNDFVHAMQKLVQTESNTWINIGSGKEHSIREFAAIICSIVGFPKENIQYDLKRYVGAKSKVLNVEKLKSILPNFSPRSLRDGLEEVVQWFQKRERLCQPNQQVPF